MAKIAGMSELHRFLFDGLAVRGILVRLDDGWQSLLARRASATPFMVLLRDGISRAVRGAVKGSADPAQRKLVSQRPLAAWGELWHALGRIQQDTERSHLDKRHAIVSALTRLKAP